MAMRIAALACAGLVSAGVVTACSYSKKDATVSPVSTPATVAVIPASPAKPVVGTLPPLHRSTSTTAPAVPATPAAAPGPTTLLPPAPAPATAPPPTQNLNEPGTASVQAGSFSTAAAAQQALSSLNRKGFGGFAIVGTAAPFRVVRGGMSQNSARALVRALSARGVDAFSRG
jgi:hypothetical protein